jgi:nucleoside-diphosphate-sugar epimerase
MEALLYMAMGRPASAPIADYDVNVRGLHLALEAAHQAGARRAVYLSTLSVYDGHLSIVSGATDSEEVPPEPRSLYGFTKLLGEHVCRFIHRRCGLPILILRLFLPVSQEKWRSEHRPGTVDCRTSAPDLARAIAAALTCEHNGIEIFHVTGVTTGRAYHHEKAKRLLGWEPLEGRDPRP